MYIVKYISVQNFHSYKTLKVYTSQKEVFYILNQEKKQHNIHSFNILDLYRKRRIY
jgi:hypothetical protein